MNECSTRGIGIVKAWHPRWRWRDRPRPRRRSARNGQRRVAHLGISMGAYYSARSGLAGEVDAAINLGGPVEAAFNRNLESMQFGMDGIVGNALGFDHQPTPDEVTTELAGFSLRSLLDQ